MAWPPPPQIPLEPPIRPGWWHQLSFDRWVAGIAADMRDRERSADVIDRPEWRAAAARVRVRRMIRDIDETLAAASAPACDCVDFNPECKWCRSDASHNNARFGPGHGTAARRAGPIEYHPGGRILSIR